MIVTILDKPTGDVAQFENVKSIVIKEIVGHKAYWFDCTPKPASFGLPVENTVILEVREK